MYRRSFLPFRFSAQICAVCLLLITALNAQNASDTAQDSQTQYKLSGTVVNGVTGEPIRRALVQLFQEPVLTDSEGKFEFDGLPEGRFSVSARKPGFFSEQEISGDSAQTVAATSANPLPITVKLVPEAVIFGRIESNGEPAENLPVKLFTRKVHEGRVYWEQPGMTTTDIDGQFRIPSLQPGTYYLLAGGSWGSRELMAGTKKQGFGEIFYNDANDFAGATPVEISAGQQTEINFSLKPTALFRVSGTITGQTGQGSNLTFTGPSGVASQLPTHFNPANGEFETLVPGGSYLLKAESYGQNGGMSAGLPIQVNADLSGIHLVLTPTISIPVDVRAENVAPAQEGPNITFGPITTTDRRSGQQMTMNFRDGSMVFVRLYPRTMSLQNQQYVSSYRVNSNGQEQNQIANIEPGRYSVEFSLNSRWYVQSAQCGSVDLLREDLTVAPGSQPPPIEVVTRNDPATLTGSVSFDGVKTVAEVLVIPNEAPSQTKATPVRDQDHFELDGLAPGDYSVVAVANAQNLEYANPEVIAPYLSHAQHVSLQASQKTEVNLELVQVGKQ